MTPQNLREWRKERNISQMQLAMMLGVNMMTISTWERGKRGIPPYLHWALKGLDSNAEQGFDVVIPIQSEPVKEEPKQDARALATRLRQARLTATKNLGIEV